MEIRPVTENEIPDCLEVIHNSYETEAKAFGITEMNYPRHPCFMKLDDLILKCDWGYTLYAAFEGEKIVACFALSERSNGAYMLHLFSVLPKYRYKGVGAKCLEYAKATVVQNGGKALYAGMAHQSVSLRSWYEKNGFMQYETVRRIGKPFELSIMSWNGQST